MMVAPRPLASIAGVPLSLVDIAMGLTIPTSIVAVISSARQLFLQLQQQDRQGA
jgi:hypothetical protein